MITTDSTVPPPDLRILPIDDISPHEEFDSQRAEPLLRILRTAEVLTNPPIVAPMHDKGYVILDGANRYHCFRKLGYPHLLVQVVKYDSPFVDLGVWQHIISAWDSDEFLQALHALDNIQMKNGWNNRAVAQLLLNDGRAMAVHTGSDNINDRNAMLRQVVSIYQRRAKLNRTALHDPTIIWGLYNDAIALVLFPQYKPEDIMQAAKEKAYLPPGVSRHIIQGRALKLNYPLEKLMNAKTSLAAKNKALQDWVHDKLSNRAVRFYAESTYQFDE